MADSTDPSIVISIDHGSILSVTTSQLNKLALFNLWVQDSSGRNIYLADYTTALDNMVAPVDMSTLQYWSPTNDGPYAMEGDYTVIAVDSYSNSTVLLRSNRVTYFTGTGTYYDFNMTNHDIVNIKNIVPKDSAPVTDGQYLCTDGTTLVWDNPKIEISSELSMEGYNIENVNAATANFISIKDSPGTFSDSSYIGYKFDSIVNYSLDMGDPFNIYAVRIDIPAGVWVVTGSVWRTGHDVPTTISIGLSPARSFDQLCIGHTSANSDTNDSLEVVACSATRVIVGPVNDYSINVTTGTTGNLVKLYATITRIA